VTAELANPSVRFVGGHHDQPDIFDYECRVVTRRPKEIVLEPTTLRRRIILRSRYVGKDIGGSDDDRTSTVCTYQFVDDSHRGMAAWMEAEDGR
jgi:hypothetical protein